ALSISMAEEKSARFKASMPRWSLSFSIGSGIGGLFPRSQAESKPNVRNPAYPGILDRNSKGSPLKQSPIILSLQGLDQRCGQVLLDVFPSAHSHQRAGDPGRRADELDGALRVGPQALEVPGNLRRQPFREPALQEAGAGEHHQAKPMRSSQQRHVL